MITLASRPVRHRRASRPLAALLAAAVLAPGVAFAQADPTPPVVPDYGKTFPVEHPAVGADPALDYKVVLNVTKSGADGAPPPGLLTAARLANLLAQSGVPASHRHLFVILHGAATPAVLNQVGLKARGKTANPSATLIAELTRAGVAVHVCGQALGEAKIKRSEVLPEVQVDLSAAVTVPTLELHGYALLPD